MTTTATLIRAATLSAVAETAAATAPPDARLIVLVGSCPLDPDEPTAARGDYAGQAAKTWRT